MGLDVFPPRAASVGSVGYEYFQADIAKPETFPEDVREASILVHCAALVHRRYADLSRANYLSVNRDGTRNTLSALDPVRLRHVVFLSTVSVYGSLKGRLAPDEHTPARPVDGYGESKVAAEQEILTFSKEHAIPHTIFRLAPVYGKNFLLNIKKRVYLPGAMAFYKVGEGDQRISLAAARNVVEAICQSIERSSRLRGTFNLKDRVDYPVNEIIRVFRMFYGRPRLPVVNIAKGTIRSLTEVIIRLSAPRGSYLIYQLRKISEDAIYSGEKLFSAGFEPRWDLASELLGDIIPG
jgi:nucleoside-diphosphate-sugar epimerase